MYVSIHIILTKKCFLFFQKQLRVYKMTKLIILVTLLVTLLAAIQAQQVHSPLISEVFARIYNVSDTVLTRLEQQTAEKQEYLLSVALGFTLFEYILLITSLILHVVSVAVLKHSRIVPS